MINPVQNGKNTAAQYELFGMIQDVIEKQEFALTMRMTSNKQKDEEERIKRLLAEIQLMPDGQAKLQRLEELRDIAAQAKIAGVDLGSLSTKISNAENMLTQNISAEEGLNQGSFNPVEKQF